MIESSAGYASTLLIRDVKNVDLIATVEEQSIYKPVLIEGNDRGCVVF